MRKLCTTKERYNLTKGEIEALEKKANMSRLLASLKEEGVVGKDATWESIPFYKPKSSPECEEGYKGRIGIHEVLMMSSAVRELALTNAPAEKIEDQACKEGMLTMLEDGIFQAAQGMTSIEEVFRVVSE